MAWGVPKIGAVATPVNGGNYTLAEPAGTAEGDLQVACFALRSTVGFTNADWTLVESQLSGDSDATNGIASAQLWWRVPGAGGRHRDGGSPMSYTLVYEADTLFELRDLRDNDSGAAVIDATVQLTALVDAGTGAPIAGQTFPLALAFLGGPDGHYRGTLSAALVVTVGQALTATVEANAGAGRFRRWSVPLKVRVRRAR